MYFGSVTMGGDNRCRAYGISLGDRLLFCFYCPYYTTEHNHVCRRRF